MENDQERKTRQRAQRAEQMNEIEASLRRADGLIEDSKREIRRSRDLMGAQRTEDARQDAEEDEADANR